MYPKTPVPLPPLVHNIQADYRVQHEECAEPLCDVLVVWYDHGQEDAAGAFKAKSCTCDHPMIFCTRHADTYICSDCCEEEEDEVEEEQSADALRKENAQLRKRLRELEENE